MQNLDLVASLSHNGFVIGMPTVRPLDPPVTPTLLPVASGNASVGLMVGGPADSGNTLFMRVNVPAGTQGIDRSTVRSFPAVQLFGSPRSVAIIVDGLPFHGIGATDVEAKSDLVATMEEMLEELEVDVASGVELSPHLLRTLNFVRSVFAVSSD